MADDFELTRPPLDAPWCWPRFTGSEVLVGEYDNAAAWEAIYRHTRGFGDPLTGSTDEARFDSHGTLRSLRVLVPQVAFSRLSWEEPATTMSRAKLRGLVVDRGWAFGTTPAGGIACISSQYSSVDSVGVSVAEGLQLLLSHQGGLQGWHLAEPERYLAVGFAVVQQPVPCSTLRQLLFRYLTLAHDEEFVDDLVDDDPEAKSKILKLLDDVKHVARTPQAEALAGWCERVLDC